MASVIRRGCTLNCSAIAVAPDRGEFEILDHDLGDISSDVSAVSCGVREIRWAIRGVIAASWR
jgi:hypothetical protein